MNNTSTLSPADRVALLSSFALLSASVRQSCDSDDQIIMDNVRKALALVESVVCPAVAVPTDSEVAALLSVALKASASLRIADYSDADLATYTAAWNAYTAARDANAAAYNALCESYRSA